MNKSDEARTVRVEAPVGQWRDQHARSGMPVSGCTRVRVRLRDGTYRTGRAANYQWTIYGMRWQQTAVDRYRILPPNANSSADSAG